MERSGFGFGRSNPRYALSAYSSRPKSAADEAKEKNIALFSDMFKYQFNNGVNPAQLAVWTDDVDFLSYCLEREQWNLYSDSLSLWQVEDYVPLLLLEAIKNRKMKVAKFLAENYNFQGRLLSAIIYDIHNVYNDDTYIIDYLWENHIDENISNVDDVFIFMILTENLVMIDWLLDHGFEPSRNASLTYREGDDWTYDSYSRGLDYFMRARDRVATAKSRLPLRVVSPR